jgi:hypothetical protein
MQNLSMRLWVLRSIFWGLSDFGLVRAGRMCAHAVGEGCCAGTKQHACVLPLCAFACRTSLLEGCSSW